MSRVWTFTEGQEVETPARPGKPEWPAAVVLVLDRRALLRLLHSVASTIDCADRGETVEITLHGALKEGES
jgi:hypothetical protein